MVGVCVEVQLVGLARRGLVQGTLQLRVHVTNHVGVTVDDHVILCSFGDVDITLAFLLEVGRLQLDMVVIGIDTKRSFEQRLRSIPLHIYTGPTHGIPSTLSCPDQRSPLENLVLVSPDDICATHNSIFIHVLHIGVIGKNIEVGFQLQFYPLATTMETERDVEFGKMIDAMRRCLNHRLVHG